jgi:dihydroflavonol-4-reductase
MKILVTGATGFIGSHLVEELAKQGLPVRAAHRPGENFGTLDSDYIIDGLDLESFPLDITHRDAVFQAMRDCQILFHTENLCSFENEDKALLYHINQTGTRNLMEAAQHYKVEKVIYTSGMETLLAPSDHEVATEKDGVAEEDLRTDFAKSRLAAEREVLHLRAKGIATIILHPTVCLGTRDPGVTPFGHFLQRYLQKKIHFYLDTGLNLIDVKDVAKAHMLAAKRGRAGARYILGNKNVYFLEILQNLAQITGIPPPKTALPTGMALLGNFFAKNILRRSGGIPTPLIQRLKRPLFFEPGRSRQDLGYPQSNVWDALTRQVEWLQRN